MSHGYQRPGNHLRRGVEGAERAVGQSPDRQEGVPSTLPSVTNRGSCTNRHSEGASGSVGSRGSEVPVSGSTVGRTNAVSYGTGTTKVVTIPQGQLFAGRTSGGATRNSIYGNT